MTRLADVLSLLEQWYDPRWAESWDTVGLVCGDPRAVLDAVHIAVDPTEAVAAEAVATGAGLLISHHPLWLGGTTTVAVTDPRGKVVTALQAAGCALLVAHTNADVAAPGVSDALGDALGLGGMRPLAPQLEALDQWVVHVPRTHTDAVRSAMSAAGAGRVGAYDSCAFTVAGTGMFRPLPGSAPFLGSIGTPQVVEEDRLEMVARPWLREAVGAAIRTGHPYEEPAISCTPTSTPGRRGLGRVGVLPAATTLGDLLRRVAGALPATAAGVRCTGELAAPVRTVAVVGGAGLDLAAAAARAGADVLVTSDAKHHRAQEASLPVLDVAHWAGEWPFTAALGARLRVALPGLRVSVSTLVTDPWTGHENAVV